MTDRHKIFLALFIFLCTVAYGAYQWNERSAMLIEADALASEAGNLTSVSKTLTEKYQSIKAEVSADRETSGQELAVVFPTDEDITALTRLFDDFSVKNNFASNPFFISGLTYQSAVSPEGMTYRYVPVSLTVTTSKKNLSKFLEFVETSGSLEGEVRLMSVADMSVSYPEEFGGSYEAKVTIYAYFSQNI